MTERRSRERRSKARDFRVDVKRGEYEQLRDTVLRLVEQFTEMQRQLDDLRRKMRS
jgi:hypothetical protein